MHESIDWPSRPSNRRGFVIVLALVIFLTFSSGTAQSYYVNVRWFGSLGYEGVYRRTLSLQWSVFAIFFDATFLILYGWFVILRKAYQPDLLDGGVIFIGRQPVKLPVKRIMNFIARVVFVVIALATGASMMGSGRPSRCTGTHDDTQAPRSIPFLGGRSIFIYSLCRCGS